MTMRTALRDLPVMLLVAALAVAVVWLGLIDLELASVDLDWVPRIVGLLAVLLMPLAAMWQFFWREKPSIWALVAPLVGAYLVAYYFAFDIYGLPPYSRNSVGGDMPGWAIAVGAAAAVGTGVLTWFHRSLGIVLTVPVSWACYVLAFFSSVFH